MAFAAITNKVIVESTSDSKDSFDDEVPQKLTLQEAHDIWKKLNEVKTEKVDLLINLDETIRLVETLVVKNTSLEEKVKNLEIKLSQDRIQIERMSSAKLNEVLSA